MKSYGMALIAFLVLLPTAARSATTLGPTVEPTSTVESTSTVCPSISCTPPFCNLEYIPGEECPGCLCFDPKCMLEGCPYDGQQCLPTGECDTCYDCLPKFETTAVPDTVESSTTSPTSTVCPIVTCDGAPFCSLYYPPWEECPFCLCFDPKCMLEGCPHDGQQCLPTGECDTCYDCLPKFDDTTTLTPTPTPTTSPCSDMWCGDGPLCFPDYSSGVCTCLCVDPKCMLEGCPPGQQCLPTGECDTCYECLPKFDTSASTPTTTTSECPIPPCAVGCHQVPGSDGCPICDCTTRTCQEVTCDPGQECVMQCAEDTTPCFPRPTCVPIIYETTTPCPSISCGPDCVTETGSDGCPRCYCPPTCQTVKCSAGYECKLVNVTCIRHPCFPVARCVATEETTTRKQCRMLRCLPTCFPGTGPDGCPSCDCPPTCQDHYCSDDEKCILQDVRCKNKRKHCFPRPTCVPKDESCDPEKEP